jgi:hypothetical protein
MGQISHEAFFIVNDRTMSAYHYPHGMNTPEHPELHDTDRG